MLFRILHTTSYHYATPASESVGELRVWPIDRAEQKVLERKLECTPSAEVNVRTDLYGNKVEHFSIPVRHKVLTVTASALVQTEHSVPAEKTLIGTVGEARKFYLNNLPDYFDFLHPSARVKIGDLLKPLRLAPFKDEEPLAKVCLRLNSWIFRSFKYMPGATDVGTPIETIVRQRKGVCQDYAHLMLAVLRHNGIAARYVSGYIEAYDPEASKDAELIGASASHAWVEVASPLGRWVGLDPTNNQAAGQRHVVVAVGRDYDDVPPMRGTYKGAADQKLRVMVSLQRRKSRAAKRTAQPKSKAKPSKRTPA